MNDEKISNLQIAEIENKIEEESKTDEEYQVIMEEYRSSPRCGMKVEIVKSVMKTIIVSPIEISTNPYFKYCVTQIKDGQKNDKSKKNNSNLDIYQNIQIKEKEKEKKEKKEVKQKEDNNYIRIIEHKPSDLTLNLVIKCNELNESIQKEKKKKFSQKVIEDEDLEKKNSFHSLRNSIKNNNIHKKMKLGGETEQKKNLKNASQQYIYNCLNKTDNKCPVTKLYKNNNNKFWIKEEKKEKFRPCSIFNIKPLNFTKDKSQEEQKNSANNKKSDVPSFTNCLKKSKKAKNSENKKFRRLASKQHSYLQLNKEKNVKFPNEDKEPRLQRRHSLIHHEEQDGGGLYLNILRNNENKKNSKINKQKNKRIKSLGCNDDLRIEKFDFNEMEKGGTPKRKWNINYKFKMDEIGDNDSGNKFKLKRKISVCDCNTKFKKLGENKLSGKKKSNFYIKEKKKSDKNKEKDKKKKLKEKINIKESKGKKLKDKLKKKKKENYMEESAMKPRRRDKSFTIVRHTKNNLNVENDHNKNINNINNNNIELNKAKGKVNNDLNPKGKEKEENEIKIKTTNEGQNTNDNCSSTNFLRSDKRQNSTRTIRENNDSNNEKIIKLTNKQIIHNTNEFIRQCLQVIPELYDLKEKMPRCKAKIKPNFTRDKKIALFDLDETIVHCMGEINMNNIESLSRQSDAKIKVQLPGGKKEVTIGINIRPHWKEAINKIKDKYHIVAFTASHESYADSVLNYLDPNKEFFEYRLYRAHCVLCVLEEMKFYVKDLKILEDNYDLKDIVIIDNSVMSFAYHLDNGIPISPFYDSKDDTKLLDIANFLEKIADEDDLRVKLKEKYKLTQLMEILKDYDSEENQDSILSSLIEEEGNGKNSTKNETDQNKTTTFTNLETTQLENKTESKEGINKNFQRKCSEIKETKNVLNLDVN
jgi:CTD small phosphatase-like protein 2